MWNASGQLHEEVVDAVDKRVREVAHAADNRVCNDDLLARIVREQGQFFEHVLQQNPPARAAHLGAFHRVPSHYVVTAGKMSRCSGLEAEIELSGGPDAAPRSLDGKCVHCFDFPAEVAHNVYRMGVKGFEVEPRAAFAGVPDPHRHVHETRDADAPFGQPFPRVAARRSETVVKIHGETETFFACQRDHLSRRLEFVGNRFFAQHMAAVFKGDHRSGRVFASVFVATRCHAHHVRAQALEHFRRVREEWNTQPFAGGLCSFGIPVAYTDESCERISLMDVGVSVSDGAEAYHAGSQHQDSTSSTDPRSALWYAASITRAAAHASTAVVSRARSPF